MSDKTELQANEKERQEILERIWVAEAKAVLAILMNTPPEELQAATLNTIRQFLGDNGINIQSFRGNFGGFFNDDRLVEKIREASAELDALPPLDRDYL